MKHLLAVGAGDDGARVDRFVLDHLKLSRSQLRALFDGRKVRIDGKPARKGDALAPGQTVEVAAEDGPPVAPDAGLALGVLYEDAAVVVVDKPAGVPSHPQRPGEVGTVASALVHRYPDMAGVGDDPREAGLVHRLDVETSGALMAARTRPAWEALRAAFSEERAVDKRYVAVVSGPLAAAGTIEVPLVHAKDHVRPAHAAEEGRPALSRFEVKHRRGRFALVEVELVTGVLHQVRAHLAAVGAPIIGDGLYGGEAVEGLDRFFLHAASLELAHPAGGRRISARSPLPPALMSVARNLGLQ